METMVKNHKKVLTGLCSNKTLKAIQRATGAAHGLRTIVKASDRQNKVPPSSSLHMHASTEELVKEMVNVIRKVNPFESHPGRKFVSFSNMKSSPLANLHVTAMHKWISSHKMRLADDALTMLGEEEGDDDIDGQDNNENLTDLEIDDE